MKFLKKVLEIELDRPRRCLSNMTLAYYTKMKSRETGCEVSKWKKLAQGHVQT
jgi:hypothetical protein